MNLETKRLLLRPLCLEDAKGDYPNWLNDKEVCRYNSHGDETYTQQMACEYITFVNNSTTHNVFAIVDKSANRHIGNISLQKIDRKNRNAEFAILIGAKEYWGSGYAFEASKTLLHYGFSILKLHRIYCGTSKANVPMQTLAKKLGFQQEGCFREALYKDGQYYDIIHYGLLHRAYSFE